MPADTLERPETAPGVMPPGGAPDACHLVCCDENTALCGKDVTDDPFLPEEDCDAPECPLCVLADETWPGCTAPGCPVREAA